MNDPTNRTVARGPNRAWRSGTILLAMTLGMCTMDEASVIEISLSPAHESYHPGEAIDVTLSIRNAGDRDVQILFGYPSDIGVLFTCTAEGAHPRSELRLGGRIPILQLKPGETRRRLVALNRYLVFDHPAKYTVEFLAEYMEPVGETNPKPATFSAKGRFVVSLSPGGVDRNRIEGWADELEGEDANRRQEAAEMILWTHDPSAIGPLVAAARRVPETAPDVVRALDKFQEPSARSAILDVARDGNAEALRAALEVYEARHAAIPVDFFRAILDSKYSGKIHPTLEYLLKHGDTRHVALVKPLESDENPEIRKLASECVARMSQRSG